MKENNAQIKDTQDDVKKYALLESVSRSEGGQMIIAALRRDVANALDKLSSLYKTAPEIEIRTWCAVISERLNLIKAFSRAPDQKKVASEYLNDLLRDIEKENEGE